MALFKKVRHQYKFWIGVSAALFNASVNAGSMGAYGPSSVGYYFSVFGGGGGVSSEATRQLMYNGTFVEVASGEVNNSTSVGLVGGNIGYQLMYWGRESLKIHPALELEGYYFKLTQKGDALDTQILNQADYRVTYPMNNGAILANALFSFEHPTWGWVKPYIGWGVGTVAVAIANADSTQILPPAFGINQYDPHKNALTWSFAAQLKAGVSYRIDPAFSIFAEYRYLYVSPAQMDFGSTQSVQPNASYAAYSWTLHLNSMSYNMGALGIRYAL